MPGPRPLADSVRRPRVLVAGSHPHGGVLSVVTFHGSSVDRVSDLDEAAARLEQHDYELFVVARDLPVSNPDLLRRLVAEAEGVERVQLLGPWCEGEGRTGVSVDGFERVFWHAWPGWWRRWQALRHDETSSADPLADAVVAIDADIDATEAIGGALASCGARCVSLGRRSPLTPLLGRADVVVWNGSQLGGLEAEQLRVCCANTKDVPVVTLLDFPRAETVETAQAIGAAAVLGKPCDSVLLCETVKNAITRQVRRVSRRSLDAGDVPFGRRERMAA